ncbi:MAG: 2OG-Fe(II) oxygenase [Planctomycetes bacterium]|nr:2OG-Fe(II) oxygenase [Planctomycetota bacterium]
MTRAQFASAIERRLDDEAARLAAEFARSRPTRHFVVDDLLPAPWLQAVAAAFPAPDQLLPKRSLRERKRVGVAVERYAPIVGDLLYAFQEPRVLAAIARLTGIEGLAADPTLYASGISVMGRGDFLNPHLDNSHDGDQQRYRVLNLLLYVAPDWPTGAGGDLELWEWPRRIAQTIAPVGGRLVVMETGPGSWHSVSRVRADARRLCVSNYYFAARSGSGRDYRHVTTFAGRPEEPVKRVVLAANAVARNLLGRVFPGLLRRGAHRRRPAAGAEASA